MNLSPNKPKHRFAILAAACVAGTLASGAPAQAAWTSYIRFTGVGSGLGLGNMDPGPNSTTISTSTQFQCLPGSCNIERGGSAFASYDQYSPFEFAYTSSPGPDFGTSFFKHFSGSLASFQILGGVNPIQVTPTTPAAGTFLVEVDLPNQRTKNRIASPSDPFLELASVRGTVKVGGQTYSNSEIVYTASTDFEWLTYDQQTATSNLWVFLFDPDPVPGPLPILGASFAFGWSRKLRNRVNQSRKLSA
jgi:hypothetical protein